MVLEKEKNIFKKLNMEMPEICIFTEVNRISKHFKNMFPIMLQEDFKLLSANKPPEHKYYKVLKRLCEVSGIPEENFALTSGGFMTNSVVFNSKYYYTSSTALEFLFHSLLEDNELWDNLKMYLEDFAAFIEEGNEYDFYEFENEVFKKNHPELDCFLISETIGIIGRLKYADVMQEKELVNKEYLPTFIYIIGEEMGQVALEKLLEFYEEHSDDIDYDKEYIYELFRETYQNSNKNFSLFSASFEKLYSETYEAVAKRKNALHQIADENGYLEIYRGATLDSTPLESAMSWTLSEVVACSFAFRYASDGGYTLYKGKIHVDDVLDNFLLDSTLERNELEVLVNPSKVKLTGEIHVPHTSKIVQLINEVKVDSTIFDTEMSVQSMIAEGVYLLEELEVDLDFSFDEILFECSDLHGMSHTKRVIYDTMTVAALHKEQLQLTGEDFDVLLVAAMLHDIGRENDCEDYEHGQMSVEKYTEFYNTWYGLKGENLEICKFLMANHNIPDEMAKDNLQSHELIEDKERAEKLYNLLTDGDGLDRVRLGDLNVAYLRNEKSKLLLPFAYDVLASV